MKPFMDNDFCLKTATARHLYHTYAERMPILDYHCHLSAQEICEDREPRNLSELWLQYDHYKWRQMRANGIAETFITGTAPDKEKFLAFAQTMPYMIGNPLYHWSHLELQRYFHSRKRDPPGRIDQAGLARYAGRICGSETDSVGSDHAGTEADLLFFYCRWESKTGDLQHAWGRCGT